MNIERQHVVMLTDVYTRLRCLARLAENDQPQWLALADRLYEIGPDAAREYFDTVKRIMEIDETVSDPHVILLRASVRLGNPDRWEMWTDAPSDPGAGSDLIPTQLNRKCPRCGWVTWNLNDIRNDWCGNCKEAT